VVPETKKKRDYLDNFVNKAVVPNRHQQHVTIVATCVSSEIITDRLKK